MIHQSIPLSPHARLRLPLFCSQISLCGVSKASLFLQSAPRNTPAKGTASKLSSGVCGAFSDVIKGFFSFFSRHARVFSALPPWSRTVFAFPRSFLIANSPPPSTIEKLIFFSETSFPAVLYAPSHIYTELSNFFSIHLVLAPPTLFLLDRLGRLFLSVARAGFSKSSDPFQLRDPFPRQFLPSYLSS